MLSCILSFINLSLQNIKKSNTCMIESGLKRQVLKKTFTEILPQSDSSCMIQSYSLA